MQRSQAIQGFVRPLRAAAGRGDGAVRRLPGHWPLTACIGLFPLWWALGAAPFIWLVFAVPLAFRLTVHRRPIRVPRGFGAWLVWIGFVVLSYFALRGGGFAFAYFLRLANYASVTVFFLAIVSAREDEIPTAHQLMYENKIHGTVSCLVGAPVPGLKNYEETVRAINAGAGR